MKILRIISYPIALIYGLAVFFRNLLYNIRLFKSSSFEIPVIVVGNLSVGGTGKTPHIEYLIRLLTAQLPATLSRGYGRKTKGYILATNNSTSAEIGDEPKQFKAKFPNTPVAVCENRVHGIQQLLADKPSTGLVLLDDAFQHRAVQPGLSILLTEYNRPYHKDKLLPAGRLRDLRQSSRRADIIIVTKSPDNITHIEKRELSFQLKPGTHQKVYFSRIAYGEPIALTNYAKDQSEHPITLSNLKGPIILMTGIANPKYMLEYIQEHVTQIEHVSFPDHHRYTAKDIQSIRKLFDNFAGSECSILTTEKDAMRLSDPELMNAIQDLPVYYLPIEIVFDEKDTQDFNSQIIGYVEKNKGNRNVSKGKL